MVYVHRSSPFKHDDALTAIDAHHHTVPDSLGGDAYAYDAGYGVLPGDDGRVRECAACI